jgi:hypothetical protein
MINLEEGHGSKRTGRRGEDGEGEKATRSKEEAQKDAAQSKMCRQLKQFHKQCSLAVV